MAAALLDLVLPERCAACGRRGTGLCGDCRCAAAPLRLAGGDPVRFGPAMVAVAAFRYDGVIARAIRTIKRPGQHAAAVHLGALLWTEIDDIIAEAARWPRTWVPATRARRRHRGTEVPRLLAGPGAVRLLRRVRQQADQTQLSAAQRRALPAGDFRPGSAVPPHVVLVDDVRTTGATAVAAASALRDGGAARILIVSLAAVDRPQRSARAER